MAGPVPWPGRPLTTGQRAFSSRGEGLRRGDDWFNPDSFTRELRKATGCSECIANAAAWAESVRCLDHAIAERTNHAFETTLGGTTITTRLREAVCTHDGVIWFCGLSSVERHVGRVAARVASGGHDIPAVKIRER